MSDTHPLQHHPRIVRRNLVAGAVNSFFVEAAMTMSEPGTVLTLFVKELTGSTFLASLLPPLRYFGWLAPQFVAATRLQGLKRMLPAVRALEAVRSSFYLLAAVLIAWFAPSRPQLALILCGTLFMVTRVAAGSSAVARNEIVARMVPSAQRPRAVSLRRVSGGIAGLLAGFLITFVLDERIASFPLNYAILVGLSGLSFALAIGALSAVQEPDMPIAQSDLGLREQARRIPELLRRDRRYARYIVVRLLSTGMTLATPFFILFARDVLAAPASLAGVYVSARTLSRILSNGFWQRRCTRHGSAWTLRAGTGAGALAPLMVVAYAILAGALVGDAPRTWIAWAYCLVFVVQGFAMSGQALGQIAYLYDIAPASERPTYYGLANTVLGPLHFVPAAGGALVEATGYASVFVIAGAMMIGAFWSARRVSVDVADPGELEAV